MNLCRTQQKEQSRQNRWHARQLRKGLCPRCGGPVVVGRHNGRLHKFRHCQKHLIERAEAMAKWRAKQ